MHSDIRRRMAEPCCGRQFLSNRLQSAVKWDLRHRTVWVGPNKVMTCKSHMDCNGAFVSIISIYVGLQIHKSGTGCRWRRWEFVGLLGGGEEFNARLPRWKGKRLGLSGTMLYRYTEMGCFYVDAIDFIKLWTINSIHYYGLVSWLSKINSHRMWPRTMLMHNSEYLQYKRYHCTIVSTRLASD